MNRPKKAVHTYHADGAMRFDAPKRAGTYFDPNSFNGRVEDRGAQEPPRPIGGGADRYNHRDGNDDSTQPGNLYRMFGAAPFPSNQALSKSVALGSIIGHDKRSLAQFRLL